MRGTLDDTTEQLLIAEFQLSPYDAALVRDRTFGGIVRAATGNEVNCPDRTKDPIAWQSFQNAILDPGIIARIYPQFVRPKPTVVETLSILLELPRLLLRKLKQLSAKRKRRHDEEKFARQLTELVRSGKYVEAMKLYRESTGAGLEETKAWIDSMRQTSRGS
ncbi:MAG: hypothetical protein QM775_14240 [Pirellulales bacterium]